MSASRSANSRRRAVAGSNDDNAAPPMATPSPARRSARVRARPAPDDSEDAEREAKRPAVDGEAKYDSEAEQNASEAEAEQQDGDANAMEQEEEEDQPPAPSQARAPRNRAAPAFAAAPLRDSSASTQLMVLQLLEKLADRLEAPPPPAVKRPRVIDREVIMVDDDDDGKRASDREHERERDDGSERDGSAPIFPNSSLAIINGVINNRRTIAASLQQSSQASGEQSLYYPHVPRAAPALSLSVAPPPASSAAAPDRRLSPTSALFRDDAPTGAFMTPPNEAGLPEPWFTKPVLSSPQPGTVYPFRAVDQQQAKTARKLAEEVAAGKFIEVMAEFARGAVASRQAGGSCAEVLAGSAFAEREPLMQSSNARALEWTACMYRYADAVSVVAPNQVAGLLEYTRFVVDLTAVFGFTAMEGADRRWRQHCANTGTPINTWGRVYTFFGPVLAGEASRLRSERPAAAKTKAERERGKGGAAEREKKRGRRDVPTTQTCNKFNRGDHCEHGEKCQYAHKCRRCFQLHPSVRCPTNRANQQDGAGGAAGSAVRDSSGSNNSSSSASAAGAGRH